MFLYATFYSLFPILYMLPLLALLYLNIGRAKMALICDENKSRRDAHLSTDKHLNYVKIEIKSLN